MEWIPFEKQTAHKQELLRLGELLGFDRRQAIGICIEFWCWADGETDDGVLPGCTFGIVDRVVGHNGFADAMVQIGWLVKDPTGKGLIVPNFERHMGESAKRRSLASRRQDKWRRKQG